MCLCGGISCTELHGAAGAGYARLQANASRMFLRRIISSTASLKAFTDSISVPVKHKLTVYIKMIKTSISFSPPPIHLLPWKMPINSYLSGSPSLLRENLFLLSVMFYCKTRQNKTSFPPVTPAASALPSALPSPPPLLFICIQRAFPALNLASSKHRCAPSVHCFSFSFTPPPPFPLPFNDEICAHSSI